VHSQLLETSLISGVFFKVLPLALGAAVSPLVVVGEMYYLTQKQAGLRQGWLFVAGNALVIGLWLAMAIWMGKYLAPPPNGADPLAAGIHFILALVLFSLGLQILLRPPSPGERTKGSIAHLTNLRALLLEMGVMAQNISSLLLFFPAANDILRASQPSEGTLLELGLLSLITLSPCLVPPLMISLGGKTGETLLNRFSRWLKPRQRMIGMMVFFGMAIYLVISGLQQN